MKPSRASILSRTEEQFLLTRISVLRKQQLKALPDNKILHDFLSFVSPEKELVAYEDVTSKNRISWHVTDGFNLELDESFFESPDKLQKAYEAVRRCFFEDFLDEDDFTELGTQVVASDVEKNSHENFARTDQMEQQAVSQEDKTDDDAMDLLDKVNDLNENTLSTDEEEVQADEFSNLSTIEESQASPGVESNAEHLVETEESEIVEEDVSHEEKSAESIPDESNAEISGLEESPAITSVEESEDQSDKSAEDQEETPENQGEDANLKSSGEEDTSAKSIKVREEVTPEPVKDNESSDTESQESDKESKSEAKSEEKNKEEAGPDFDVLAQQLTEVGMEEDKIDSLLSAVRSGKAPIETVQSTIDKLKASQE